MGRTGGAENYFGKIAPHFLYAQPEPSVQGEIAPATGMDPSGMTLLLPEINGADRPAARAGVTG